MTKEQTQRNYPSSITITVSTKTLVEYIENHITRDETNWSIAWNLCRLFPGLEDASGIAEYFLKKISPDVSAEDKENGITKEPIPAIELVEIIKKLYEVID